MTEMHTLPRATYAGLLARHSTRLVAETDREAPRARELSAAITEIAARARAAGVMLDDASAAADPRAAALRAEMDAVVPEFTELERRLATRISTTQGGRRRLEAAIAQGAAEVAIPADEAALLLGLDAA